MWWAGSEFTVRAQFRYGSLGSYGSIVPVPTAQYHRLLAFFSYWYCFCSISIPLRFQIRWNLKLWYWNLNYWLESKLIKMFRTNVQVSVVYVFLVPAQHYCISLHHKSVMETNRYVWAWWNFVSCCRSDYTNILDSTYSHSRAQGSQNIPTNRETERTNIRFDGTTRTRNSWVGLLYVLLHSQYAYLVFDWEQESLSLSPDMTIIMW